MVSDLMRDHVGLREFASLDGAAQKPLADAAEEAGVEVDAPAGRAIERPGRRAREAAAALVGAFEQPQPRGAVLLAFGLENRTPRILGVAEHSRDKLPGLIGRCAGAALL